MKSIKSITSLLLTLALLLTLTSLALAQGGARVYLQPVESTDKTLTVEVMLENVNDLYGAEFQLAYDPAVLAVADLNTQQDGIQIETGTFLPADKGFVVANKVNPEKGEVVFAMTLLNPAPPVSGKGALARVKFNILQNSPATINVAHAKLVAANLQTIPSETTALTIGNANQQPAAGPIAANQPPAAGGGFPWWIIAILVMGLGVALLAGLIIWGGSKAKPKAQTATTPIKPKAQAAPVKPQQPMQPSGSRPSAFKQSSDLRQKP